MKDRDMTPPDTCPDVWQELFEAKERNDIWRAKADAEKVRLWEENPVCEVCSQYISNGPSDALLTQMGDGTCFITHRAKGCANGALILCRDQYERHYSALYGDSEGFI